MTKFMALYDLHWGYERTGGHKKALHDPRALDVALEFMEDFKPDTMILGGDILDCGVISHHNHGKPGATEGLKLIADAQECKENVIDPLTKMIKGEKVYLIGNHEDWLTDLTDQIPALEGLIEIDVLLGLTDWRIVPQGGAYNLGKLTFIHGDTVRGGEHVAKVAVTNYERSIRFGHHHTAQLYTKNSALDYRNAKTGMAVPCLCTKTPKYGEGSPNRWCQGFLYGYINPGGTFNDSLVIITDGRATINGKVYGG